MKDALIRFICGFIGGFTIFAVLFLVLVLTGEYTFTKYIQSACAIGTGTGLAFAIFFP